MCAGFTQDARHIHESDANVARTCRAKSAQQGMLLLDPSVLLAYIQLSFNQSVLHQILTLDSVVCLSCLAEMSLWI
jgi:hypothetical protein